jgi:PPOX class probable F420-dependent enzyme
LYAGRKCAGSRLDKAQEALVDRNTALDLIETTRVAILGTVRRDGSPHLVPCVFALADPLVYVPVDAKPKRTRALTRLTNIERDPRGAVLFHEWDEDWSRLWWVRIDGHARVLDDPADLEEPRSTLLARYPQYSAPAELHPIIELRIDSWAGWLANAGDAP